MVVSSAMQANPSWVGVSRVGWMLMASDLRSENGRNRWGEVYPASVVRGGERRKQNVLLS